MRIDEISSGRYSRLEPVIPFRRLGRNTAKEFAVLLVDNYREI
jgi:hypothetical protein